MKWHACLHSITYRHAYLWNNEKHYDCDVLFGSCVLNEDCWMDVNPPFCLLSSFLFFVFLSLCVCVRVCLSPPSLFILRVCFLFFYQQMVVVKRNKYQRQNESQRRRRRRTCVRKWVRWPIIRWRARLLHVLVLT